MPDVIPPIVGDATVINAGFWLKAAHGAVRRFCGWHVAPIVEQTLILDGSGGRDIFLPSLRVVELLSVLNDGTDVTAQVDTSRAGMLRLQSGRWTDRFGRVSVRLNHGYDLDEVPELAGLIATLSQRGQSRAVFVSESIGPAARTAQTGRDGGVLSIPLLESEQQLLEPYRINGGA